MRRLAGPNVGADLIGAKREPQPYLRDAAVHRPLALAQSREESPDRPTEPVGGRGGTTSGGARVVVGLEQPRLRDDALGLFGRAPLEPDRERVGRPPELAPCVTRA